MKEETNISDVGLRVKKVISDVLSIDLAEIKENSSLTNDLGASSIHMVEFMIALGDEFKVGVNEEDVESILIVKDAINYIKKILDNV